MILSVGYRQAVRGRTYPADRADPSPRHAGKPLLGQVGEWQLAPHLGQAREERFRIEDRCRWFRLPGDLDGRLTTCGEPLPQ